jgi:hypothetical protein
MVFGFHCVAKIKEGLLNINTGAYFAYKHQMWQKYFLRIIVTFGYKQKKHTAVDQYFFSPPICDVAQVVYLAKFDNI